MRTGILSLAVIMAAFSNGCGNPEAEGRVDVYPATGTIKYQGSPVADALVSFSPDEEGQPVATGRTNAQGEFTLTTYESGDGAAPGSYTVIVTKTAAAAVSEEPEHAADADAYAEVDVATHGAQGGADSGGSLLPQPSQPLTATVTTDPDKNHFDLVIE